MANIKTITDYVNQTDEKLEELEKTSDKTVIYEPFFHTNDDENVLKDIYNTYSDKVYVDENNNSYYDIDYSFQYPGISPSSGSAIPAISKGVAVAGYNYGTYNGQRVLNVTGFGLIEAIDGNVLQCCYNNNPGSINSLNYTSNTGSYFYATTPTSWCCSDVGSPGAGGNDIIFGDSSSNILWCARARNLSQYKQLETDSEYGFDKIQRVNYIYDSNGELYNTGYKTRDNWHTITLFRNIQKEWFKSDRDITYNMSTTPTIYYIDTDGIEKFFGGKGEILAYKVNSDESVFYNYYDDDSSITEISSISNFHVIDAECSGKYIYIVGYEYDDEDSLFYTEDYFKNIKLKRCVDIHNPVWEDVAEIIDNTYYKYIEDYQHYLLDIRIDAKSCQKNVLTLSSKHSSNVYIFKNDESHYKKYVCVQNNFDDAEYPVNTNPIIITDGLNSTKGGDILAFTDDNQGVTTSALKKRSSYESALGSIFAHGWKFSSSGLMVGADGTNDGSSGMVPAPTATDNNKYLKGDGTWSEVQGGSSASYDSETRTIIFS